MRAAGDVEGQISADPGACLGHAGICPQVDLFVFDGAPQALDKDIVAPRALAIHADLDLAGGQHLDELGRGELAALICVEDLGRAVTCQRLLDSFHAKIGLQRDRHPPGQHPPGDPHDAGPVQLHPLGQTHDGLALQNEGMNLSGRQLRRVGCDRGRDPCGRNPAADDALTVIGLEPVDAGFVLGELLPDRQEKARHDMQRGFRELRHLGQFRRPSCGKGRAVRLKPVGVLHDLGRHGTGLGRADQSQARLDGAIIQHQAGRGHLHRGPARVAVDQKPRLRVIEPVERIRERGRRVAQLLRDGDDVIKHGIRTPLAG